MGAASLVELTGAATDEAPPLGFPTVRYADLTYNSTRWEKLAAAGTDEQLVKQWWGLGSISLLSAVVVSTILCSILCYKKIRNSPFNLYLVGLMIPDFIFSSQCAIVCFMSAAVGHFYSPALCRYQSFFLVFGVAGNSWMNLVIALELYKMLRVSSRRTRYFPPTKKTVTYQILAVYLWSILLGVIVFMIPEDSQFPLKIGVNAGYFCMPQEYDVASSLFYFLCFFPLLSSIPMMVVFWVFYDVYFRSQLMPKNGRGRMLAIYFLRIIIIFFVWWAPGLVVSLLIAGNHPWVNWIFSAWTHLQGTASALLTLLKPDIYNATKSFVTCRPLSLETQQERRDSSVFSSILIARVARSLTRRLITSGLSLRRMSSMDVDGEFSDGQQYATNSTLSTPNGGSVSAGRGPAISSMNDSTTRCSSPSWYEVTEEDMQYGMDINGDIEKVEGSTDTANDRDAEAGMAQPDGEGRRTAAMSKTDFCGGVTKMDPSAT